MTRSQLTKAVARVTGDDHNVILSRGFNLVDESIPIDDGDFDALIEDWNRIRGEGATSRVGRDASAHMRASRVRNRKHTRISANVVS